jgi:hypothetical protein
VGVKTKHIDDTCVILFTIGLNGLAKNLYMSIVIHAHNVNGGRVRISYLAKYLVLYGVGHDTMEGTTDSR